MKDNSSSKSNHTLRILGVDAGGTFTDFVYFDSQNVVVHKLPSTPRDPSRAITQGVADLGLAAAIRNGEVHLVHGSTVATNAVLEGRLANTAYVTNKGLADVLSIGRQSRRDLFDLTPPAIQYPVPKQLCFEVSCRRDAQGHEVRKLDEDELQELIEKVVSSEAEAVAINLLFSFLDASEEQRIQEGLREHAYVACSSSVLPEYREYERGIATWLNAALGPVIDRYVGQLEAELRPQFASIMQSNGGLSDLQYAKQRGVSLLLSGPAGGLAAVSHIARELGRDQILSFDMGGTSTDVALMDKDFGLSTKSTVSHWPVAIPMLDITTIGAGGGSIAWLDGAGMLHVGPQSAGADPGPVCYGQGGEEITVTDANVFLKRICTEQFLGGRMSLDLAALDSHMGAFAAKAGLEPKALAEGILALAEQHMVSALRQQSIQKGYDPSEFALCCFGGAGGLHACEIAEQLNVKEIIMPNRSGVFSALGMLVSDEKRLQKRSWFEIWNTSSLAKANQLAQTMVDELMQAFDADASRQVNTQIRIEMRYVGQAEGILVQLNPESDALFEAQHRLRFGHNLDSPIEAIALVVELRRKRQFIDLSPSLESQRPAQHSSNQALSRASIDIGKALTGPLIIYDDVSTLWLKEEWSAQKMQSGHLLLTKLN